MKPLSIFITIGIMYLTIPSLAQNEEGVGSMIYCELVAAEKFLSTKMNVVADFGDPRIPSSYNYILDESGHPKEFYSIVDGLNYMTQRGWEFVQVYVVTTADISTAHYLFRKKYRTE